MQRSHSAALKNLEPNSFNRSLLNESLKLAGALGSGQVASTGDATLAQLPRESYTKLMNIFPEQHELIMRNITLKFGLDMQGNAHDVAQTQVPMSLEEEAARPRIKELIKEALWNHNIATLGLMMDAAIIGNSEDVLKVGFVAFGAQWTHDGDNFIFRGTGYI